MKIVIAGGTGQVGSVLTRHFIERGDDVVVLSRHAAATKARVRQWDAETLGAWSEELNGAEVVINLAGRNVNCRYTGENRRIIMESRVTSTRVIGQTIALAKNPPRVWLQASTATIYAHRFDAPNDERGLIDGNEVEAPDTWRFSTEVAKSWEQTLDEAPTPRTRKVKLRSAMIMSPDRGGIFYTLLQLIRAGLGGTAASGDQFISWIHQRDFTRAIDWLIAHEKFQDAVNLAAPQPLPNREFMATLRKAYGMPIGLPAARWMLEIGALVLRTETELILKSRRVTPGRLIADGFTFDFPDWESAARELCVRWKSRNAHGR